jgi:hypothetical protein
VGSVAVLGKGVSSVLFHVLSGVEQTRRVARCCTIPCAQLVSIVRVVQERLAMFLPTLQLSSGFVEAGRCSCRQVLCSSGVVVFCAEGQTHVVSIADLGSTCGFPAHGLAIRYSPCQPRPEPRGVMPGGGRVGRAGKAAETRVHVPAALVSLVAYVLWVGLYVSPY